MANTTPTGDARRYANLHAIARNGNVDDHARQSRRRPQQLLQDVALDARNFEQGVRVGTHRVCLSARGILGYRYDGSHVLHIIAFAVLPEHGFQYEADIFEISPLGLCWIASIFAVTVSSLRRVYGRGGDRW